MVFSSAIFLFAFLPICFLTYRLVPGMKGKNAVLILFSLVFYSFGSLSYLPLLLFSVLCNYIAGVLLMREGCGRKAVLAGAMTVNLALLAAFKYLDFLIGCVNGIFGISIPMTGIALPIGISFFTFQGMSYVIDVYRKPEAGTKSFGKVLLYISLFPQLVAGPIVKYLDIAHQIDERSCSAQLTAQGVRRFIAGLSKKLLLANTLGYAADAVFALSSAQLDIRSAWLGAICYTLQIYFDFDGYSDMAIGLGKMFGFSFYENFNYPYVSSSIKEFWRRWHISLSSWFRDYLYIPLGGNRKGTVRARVNRLIVFFCTGLWHGASWTFVLWGMWHGVLITLEDMLRQRQKKTHPVIGRIYTILAVILGFVIFRADTLSQAGIMFAAMFGGISFTAAGNAAFWNIFSLPLFLCIILAAVCALPVGQCVYSRFKPLRAAAWPAAMLLLVLDILNLASTSFNPFIYFRF